jgi:hypothetical protein
MSATAPRVRRVEGLVPERAVLGLTLLGIGPTIIASFVVDGLDRYMFVAVSAILLTAFAVSREYGFAIPAGITGGMGAMVLITSSGPLAPAVAGSVFFLALAAGFAAVWILGLMSLPRETSPWPLAPAAILGTLGVLIAAGQPMAFDWVQAGLAGIFVIAGAAMVLRKTHN